MRYRKACELLKNKNFDGFHDTWNRVVMENVTEKLLSLLHLSNEVKTVKRRVE